MLYISHVIGKKPLQQFKYIYINHLDISFLNPTTPLLLQIADKKIEIKIVV